MHRIAWLCVGLALGAAAPAGAVENLTGTYEGKLRCRSIASGVTDKTTIPVTVEVGHQNDLVTIDLAGLVEAIQGYVVSAQDKPQNGVVAAASCGFDSQNLDGAVLHAEVRTKPGSEKASIQGTLIRTHPVEYQVELCSFRVKRVSTVPPNLTPCL